MRRPLQIRIASPFVASTAMLIAAMFSTTVTRSANAADPVRLYVGTYTSDAPEGSRGIYVVDFNPATGQLGEAKLAGKTDNPSFLAFDPSGTRLYSVSEIHADGDRSGAALVAWSIQADGTLRELGRAPSGGGAPCFVQVRADGKFAGVANYSGGSTAFFALDEAGVPKRVSLFQHTGSSVNQQRQTAPHAHAFQFEADNNKALVADLGTDELIAFNIDEDGQLSINKERTIKLPAGHGPRHFAFAPNAPYVAVIEELDSMVTVLRDNGATFTVVGDYSTLPKDFSGSNTTAEVLFHPSGKYVYGSNRGHDSIAVFKFNAVDGKLTSLGQVKTGGSTPRNFRISPDGKWLIAANQESNSLVVFQIGVDGVPTRTEHETRVPKPVCLKFTSEIQSR